MIRMTDNSLDSLDDHVYEDNRLFKVECEEFETLEECIDPVEIVV